MFFFFLCCLGPSLEETLEASPGTAPAGVIGVMKDGSCFALRLAVLLGGTFRVTCFVDTAVDPFCSTPVTWIHGRHSCFPISRTSAPARAESVESLSSPPSIDLKTTCKALQGRPTRAVKLEAPEARPSVAAKVPEARPSVAAKVEVPEASKKARMAEPPAGKAPLR